MSAATGVVVSVVVVVALVVALTGLYIAGGASAGSSQGNPGVIVAGFNFTVESGLADRGSLNASYTCTSGCPFTVVAGSAFNISVHLTNSGTSSFSVLSSSATSPFATVSVDPPLPIVLAPAGSVSLTMTIQAPLESGSYNLTGSIVTD